MRRYRASATGGRALADQVQAVDLAVDHYQREFAVQVISPTKLDVRPVVIYRSQTCEQTAVHHVLLPN